MIALKALLLGVAALLLLGCESETPPPEQRADHVFDGHVEAIDKAREVETIVRDSSKQSQ